MRFVHVLEVEWVHALSCFRMSFGGLDPSTIAVCWSGVCVSSEYAQARSGRVIVTRYPSCRQYHDNVDGNPGQDSCHSPLC